MADTDKIKRILQKSVRSGKFITERQLLEVTGKVAQLRTIDENVLRSISQSVTQDSEIFILAATDMGDIKSELAKPKK